MAGAEISIAVAGLDAVKARLANLAATGADLTPAMKDIGMALVVSTQRRFEREQGPDGMPWKPIKNETVLKRLGGKKRVYTKGGRVKNSKAAALAGAKILRDRNRLYQSLTYRADKAGVEVGTNVVYAATHQFGRGKIPARPFLGLDADDASLIEHIVARHLAGATA